jgi:hypothetical protein
MFSELVAALFTHGEILDFAKWAIALSLAEFCLLRWLRRSRARGIQPVRSSRECIVAIFSLVPAQVMFLAGAFYFHASPAFVAITLSYLIGGSLEALVEFRVQRSAQGDVATG